ncbi:hypothetical protein [Frisingicoccus sp.]|uniref:hypothetical protein n=1 Tax=Frisingicoccus sp. TaxID=1918627 RepID=UPI003AB78B8D
MKKQIWIITLVISVSMIGLMGCAGKTERVIEKNRNENIEFPKRFEKSYDKVDFQADVVIADGVDLNQICRKVVNRAYYDNDRAYERLFQGKELKIDQQNEVFGDNGEMIPNRDCLSVDGESFSMDGQTLNFVKPFTGYIFRCMRLEKRNPEYNMDRYELNGDLDFMSREEGENQIVSLLADIGFEEKFDFLSTVYAMDYKTMEQEEYAMDMEGNEDTSRYKEVWTEEDNCYNYFLRQEIDGLPLYYLYGGVFKELDICNVGVNAVYSKDGLQYIRIDKLFVVDDSVNPVPVSFLEIEELAQSVDEQYSMIISDADFVVHQMALYLMAEKASDETYYELFPVWILSMEQIQDKQGEKVRTPLQSVIHAETGEVIS